MPRGKGLSSKEYQEKNAQLCEKFQSSDSPSEKEAALDELFRLNERMIHAIIKKMKYFIEYDYDVDDMVQTGAIALFAAASKYDKSKGYFSTYAYYWILHAIQKGYGDCHGAIRIPTGPALIASRFIAKTNSRPDSERFEEALSADETLSEKDKEIVRTVVKARSSLSLNNISSTDENDDEFIDMLAYGWDGYSAPSAEDEAIKNIATDELEDLLGTLEPREEWILRHRKIDHEWSLEECGKRCPWGELSVTRVCQIEKLALSKIRSSSKSGFFKEILK